MINKKITQKDCGHVNACLVFLLLKQINYTHYLSICILVTPKCILWQLVKALIKCHIVISSGTTLFAYIIRQNNLQRNKYNFIYIN